MRGYVILLLVMALSGCAFLHNGVLSWKAPPTVGQTPTGQQLDLVQYQGKVVLVSFWFSHCPPCRALFHHEKALLARYAGKPFALIGINADASADEARLCEERFGLTWPSIWDAPTSANGEMGSGPICDAWKVNSFPALFLIDTQGVVRYKQVGIPPDGWLESKIDELLARK